MKEEARLMERGEAAKLLISILFPRTKRGKSNLKEEEERDADNARFDFSLLDYASFISRCRL